MNLEAIAAQIMAEGKTSELLALLCSKAVPADVQSDEIDGPLRFRPMVFNGIGSKVPGHSHNYDHHTFIQSGSVLVKFFKCGKDGVPTGEVSERIFRSWDRTHKILILAGTWHEFTALEENTRAVCVFPHRDENGNISTEYTGNDAAYV